MKTAAAIVLAVSVASASASLSPRQIDKIPPCALQCAIGQITSTGCAQTDFACICSASAFVAGLVPCVQAACTPAQFDDTVKAAQGLCSAAGVTLSIPSGPVSTSAGTSSMPATMTSEMSSMMTESSMMSSMMSESSMISSMVSSMATTTVAGTTTSRNGSVTVTTTPPSATGSPGAASRNTVALSGLGAILAFVAALL